MTDNHKMPPTEAETKAKRLSRWESEGGAKKDIDVTRKEPERPRDPNHLAKMVVDLATGDTPAKGSTWKGK